MKRHPESTWIVVTPRRDLPWNDIGNTETVWTPLTQVTLGHSDSYLWKQCSNRLRIINSAFQWKTFKTLGRIPNRKDSDYFDSYENCYWRPIPWYNRIFNFISRCLYFMTGPKCVIPIVGNVLDKVHFLFQVFWSISGSGNLRLQLTPTFLNAFVCPFFKFPKSFSSLIYWIISSSVSWSMHHRLWYAFWLLKWL